MKSVHVCQPLQVIRRSPHGERGLKSFWKKANDKTKSSLPTRGAWIEIALYREIREKAEVAPHTGSVD